MDGGTNRVEEATEQGPGPGRKLLRIAFVLLGGLAVVAFAVAAWIWFAPCQLGGCAPLDDLAEYQAEGSVLLDVDGNSIGTLATVNRRIISIDSLPEHVPGAFVAVEDHRFYDHSGLDVFRLAGAMLANLRAGGVEEGGSTISMQLARNLFPEWLPYQSRTIRRKLMEARVARQLERTFSKDKILELYLNHIYLGEGAYGVEAAARTYFGKSAHELDIAEAALLGGLPQAPSSINPVANEERSLERRNLVLGEMAEAGYISAAEAAEARERPIQLTRGTPDEEAQDGSYFIERVRREMESAVGSRFYTAGLTIHTTMDRTAQQAAEEELARQLTAIESGQYGTYRHPTYAASDEVTSETGETPYLQGVVVVLEAATGEVRALVGGRDFDDSKFDRAVQALRQPGSAFKPFIYLAGLQRYGSPVQILEDSPLHLTLSGNRTWSPRNYGDSYDGAITMRDALVRSKNTATVRLAQDVGLNSAINIARDLGITSEIPDVPATALGAAGVRPLELVAAYAAFGNGGHQVEPRFITRVTDRNGRTIWEAPSSRAQNIDPAAAFVLTTMLRDVVDRGTGTAVRAAGFRGPAAGKTGTTNGNTDVWFVGYTPDLAAGVWIGMDRPASIVSGASGGTLAAPVWGRVMNRIYQDREMSAEWSPPAGVQTAQVDRTTGSVVDEMCPAQGPTYTEYFIRSIPRGNCQTLPAYASDYGDYGVYGDTIWGDEEWGVLPSDTSSVEMETGVEWPELEELRRRVREGIDAFEDEQAERESERTAEIPDPRSASPPRSAQPEEPEPEPTSEQEEPAPRPDPPLLGVPVQRDSAGGGAGEVQNPAPDTRFP